MSGAAVTFGFFMVLGSGPPLLQLAAGAFAGARRRVLGRSS